MTRDDKTTPSKGRRISLGGPRNVDYLISPKKCFVAHFDVLGMRTLIAQNGITALSLMCDLFEIRNKALRISVRLNALNLVIEGRVEQLAFSDTVFLHTKAATKEDLCAISMTAADLLAGAGAKGIPVRGGLACGEVYHDNAKQLFTGKAILDAYQAGEAAKWLGIVASEEVARLASEVPLRFMDGKPLFRECNVPLGHGKSCPGFAMDWPYLTLKPKVPSSSPPSLTGEGFYEDFAKFFGPYDTLSLDAKAKYENTAAFVNDCFAGRE